MTIEQETEIIFDRAGFIRRLMGDEELAMDILGKFFDEISRQIVLLKEICNKPDIGEAGPILHTMKGSCGNTGAIAMKNVVYLLESAAKAGDWNELRRLLPQLEEQLDLLKKTSKTA